MLNTLVHKQFVRMGLQWAVLKASDVYDPLQTLVNRINVYKGV